MSPTASMHHEVVRYLLDMCVIDLLSCRHGSVRRLRHAPRKKRRNSAWSENASSRRINRSAWRGRRSESKQTNKQTNTQTHTLTHTEHALGWLMTLVNITPNWGSDWLTLHGLNTWPPKAIHCHVPHSVVHSLVHYCHWWKCQHFNKQEVLCSLVQGSLKMSPLRRVSSFLLR